MKDQLTRQSLLLEFLSECVGLQSVPDLESLLAARLAWICDYDSCAALLPAAQGVALWSQDRKTAHAAMPGEELLLAGHRAALEETMATGSPTLARDAGSGMFLAAVPFGAKVDVFGALCVARAADGFSHSDLRHLQHAANAVGGALARIAALAAEREAERSVKLAEAALRAAAEDRMLLAEQMVGIVSHDLRNPLSAILMGTELMRGGEALPAQKQRVLKNVTSAARRAQRLVEELLDFTQARLGRGLPLQRTDVDLGELMRSIVDELRLSFSNVVLHSPDDPSASARLDVDRIHQLFGNLVANAATYGTPGAPIQLGCAADAGDIVLSVRNAGQPIPEAMLATMFEPMVRGSAHPTGQHGIGLGLYIVRAIAQSHGGTVEVTSNAVDGTCFSVRLPADGV